MAELTKTKTKSCTTKKGKTKAPLGVPDADVFAALEKLPPAPEGSLETLENCETSVTDAECENQSEARDFLAEQRPFVDSFSEQQNLENTSRSPQCGDDTKQQLEITPSCSLSQKQATGTPAAKGVLTDEEIGLRASTSIVEATAKHDEEPLASVNDTTGSEEHKETDVESAADEVSAGLSEQTSVPAECNRNREREANAPADDCGPALYPALDDMSPPPSFTVEYAGSHRAREPDACQAPLAREVTSDLAPLTDAQVASLYHNPQLEANAEFVDAFLQTVDQSKHEFFEILQNYYRARNQLHTAELDVQTLQKDAENYRNLVWEMEKKVLVLNGQCADKSKVSAEHSYIRAVYHKAPCDQMASSLKDIRDVLHQQLALSSYETQFSRLHVEAYLYELYKNSPLLSNMAANFPVSVRLHKDMTMYQQLLPLKTCINILFMFVRKPCKCPVFAKDVKNWIVRLAGSLLLVADREDHLYLLNHILRCPAGVGKWAACCVQMVEPPPLQSDTAVLGHPLLDHYLAVLDMTLMPIRQREQLLTPLKVTLTAAPEGMTDTAWIMVDSDGEEDEDPQNSWHMLQENDLVALLNQMPVSIAFKHVLGVQPSATGSENVYSPSQGGSESATLKLFAFATRLMRILERGLHTYSMSRYRQLNKRIARYIRHTVWFVADHIDSTGVAQRSDRIQIEFDNMFLKAVTILLSANRFGAWQFLSDLPYRQVSKANMWRLLWKMHVPEEKRNLFSLPVDIIKQQLAEPDSIQEFEDRLVNMATSEALYLLNTFANMARSRGRADIDFVTLVLLEIYEIAYLSEHTREFCSRQGRELLASVLSQHPDIFSAVLNRTAETMQNVGKVAVFLFKGLPVALWIPTTKDLTVLQSWLIDNSLHSPESALARTIIERLNWNFNENAEDGASGLWLDVCIHRYMATVLMGAYAKHLTGRHFANTYTIRQMGPWVRNTDSEEDKMATWLWERALRLHLHVTTHPPVTGALPDIYTEDKFHIIHSGLEKNFSLASYFVLVMTRFGHNIGDFCQEGLGHLEKLVEQGYHLPAIHTLSLILPLLFYNTEYLYSNSRFRKILEQVLYMDTSKGGMFYSEFPGPVTTYFSAMIQDHIFRKLDGQNSRNIIEFWLRMLTKLNKWQTDRNVLYVLNNLVKASNQLEGDVFDMTLTFFYEMQKTLHSDSEQGMLSSLSSWFGSPLGSPSMLDSRSWPGLTWLAYAVLSAEEQVESESGTWTQLQQALRHYDQSHGQATLSVDFAVKIVSKNKGKRVEQQKLLIYRWAQLAIDTPASDPVLPLVWQRFFLLYLHRPILTGSLRERASTGDKFFESGNYLSMMKSMKQKLKETSHYYDQMAKGCSQEMTSVIRESDDAASSLQLDARCGPLQVKMAYYNQAVRLFDSLCFWLDEPRLHDACLYLPALPSEYEADRLLTVIQDDRTPWNHLVNWQVIAQDLLQLASQWKNLLSPASQPSPVSSRTLEYRQTAAERVLGRLERKEDMSPPPKVTPGKAPIPAISDVVLHDKPGLLFSLRSDFSALVDCAKAYQTKVSQHVALDHQFVEWLPKLCNNKATSVTLSVPCRSLINPLHSCKGPAALSTIYEAMKEDAIVSRKIDENRAEYKQLLIAALLPPSQNVCSAAVHVENTITKLIRVSQVTRSQELRVNMQDIGVTLFYHITTFISEDTKFYPPTKQFFTSCIEALGQEFIRANPNQAQPLMQAILQNSSLLGVLSPNFNPTSSPELFLGMYRDMLEVPVLHGSEVAFTLLSKFDVHQWLHLYEPALSQRQTLVATLCDGLCKCGADHQSPHDMVFEVYRTHLESVLCFNFPDVYGAVLKQILKGSSMEKLSAVVWEDFVRCLASDGSRIMHQASEEFSDKAIMQQLTSNHLEESVRWMSSHFANERTNTETGAKYGVYPKWKPYLPSVAKYIGAILIACVNTAVKDLNAGFVDPQTAVGTLWRFFHSLYWPWIQPHDIGGHLLAPWIESDAEHAALVLRQWIVNIVNIQRHVDDFCQGLENKFMNLLWQFYATSLSGRSSAEHVTSLIHTHLNQAPWHAFCPTLGDVQSFNKVLDGNESVCAEFVCSVACAVDWNTVLERYTDMEQGFETTAIFHAQLFHLLVRLGAHTILLQKETGLIELLGKSEKFAWDLFLDGDSFQLAAESYCHACDARCVMVERTSPSAAVLRLLKKASGFYHSPGEHLNHPELELKRTLYVKCLSQLMCKCTKLKDVKLDVLKIGISNLLTEAETVVASVSDSTEQISTAMLLCKEVLNILNCCQAKTVQSLLDATLQWIEDSHSSPLLYSLLSATCLNLASLPSMLSVTEACIDAHFAGAQVASSGRWSDVLAALRIPDLNQAQFLQQGVVNGAFLTLYAYTMQRLPLSQCIGDEFRHFQNLVQWTGQVKPSSDNEHKLFLWWTKVLELALRQADLGGPLTEVKQKLTTFSAALWTLGEDKDSSGLLGAIGLGKRSLLSYRFRVVSKCLASYITTQLPKNLNRPRLSATDPGHQQNAASSRTERDGVQAHTDVLPCPQAAQYLAHIEGLKQSKDYASHKKDIEFYLEYVTDKSRSLREANALLVKLVSDLYPEQGCLVVLRQ